ncbi:MAG: Tn3 family transposase [Sphingomonadales bacterium]|nr:Tn3 family transposase [Sphingomonadales bacterium]
MIAVIGSALSRAYGQSAWWDLAHDTVHHVFGLCRLLGFRFAPRIRDLSERRL